MKKTPKIALLITLTASLLAGISTHAAADEIKGRAWLAENGKAPAYAAVTILCAGVPRKTFVKSGQYRARNLPRLHGCKLFVDHGNKRSNAIAIPKGHGKIRMDLELATSGDSLVLTQK